MVEEVSEKGEIRQLEMAILDIGAYAYRGSKKIGTSTMLPVGYFHFNYNCLYTEH